MCPGCGPAQFVQSQRTKALSIPCRPRSTSIRHDYSYVISHFIPRTSVKSIPRYAMDFHRNTWNHRTQHCPGPAPALAIACLFQSDFLEVQLLPLSDLRFGFSNCKRAPRFSEQFSTPLRLSCNNAIGASIKLTLNDFGRLARLPHPYNRLVKDKFLQRLPC